MGDIESLIISFMMEFIVPLMIEYARRSLTFGQSNELSLPRHPIHLNCICKGTFFKTPPKILKNMKHYPWYKDCVGAIDAIWCMTTVIIQLTFQKKFMLILSL